MRYSIFLHVRFQNGGFFLLLFLLVLATANASILVPDKNPCVAYGNGSVFNISSLFDWPVKVRGPGLGGEYEYTWDCHGGVKCENDDDNKTLLAMQPSIAVCQTKVSGDGSVGLSFPAGYATQTMWFASFNWYYDPSRSDNNFTIMYPTSDGPGSPYSGIAGGGIRVTHVTFMVDESVKTPQIEMSGEYPYTEYHISVRGACLGQPRTPNCPETVVIS
eukprot:m.285511 g.285511  ORF g.285511 m.285511 type:complete len:218 (-) comp16341_c0_seq16:48-701(-)